MSPNLLFFFSALGAFNGMLFAVYFLLKREGDLRQRLFGGFLLALSVRVGKSVFYYFDTGLAQEYLQLGLTACLFIGPLLYFFVRTTREGESERLRRRLFLHLGIWGLIAVVGGMLYPYPLYPELWRGRTVQFIYFVWLAYTLAAGWRIWERRATAEDRLVLFSVLGSLLLVLIYLLTDFTHYIAGALTFSVLLYASWAAFALYRKSPSPSQPAAPPANLNLLDEATADRLAEKLAVHVARDRPYLNPNLKLTDLADAIGCSSHQLSHLLNNHLGKSFHEYVGELRVSAAEELLATSDHLTLEAISQSVGFNSRSTFYAAFRRIHGTTPAKFRKT